MLISCFFFNFIYFNWRLITLQYCSGFSHPLTWIQVASVVSDSMRPHRQQPTRLPHSWDSPGKITGVGCHFLLQCMKVKVKSPSCVWLLATPWTAAHQAPLSIGFPKQEYWSGLPFPSTGDIHDPGTEPSLLNCRQILYCLSLQGSPIEENKR